MKIDFLNPRNGYVERAAVTSATWFWLFLFGPLFLAWKGLWTPFLVACVLAVITGGLSWFIIPFFSKTIIAGHYRRNGWKEI